MKQLNIRQDCGWAWVIALALFTENILRGGMTSSIGIYTVYIMDAYNVNLTQATIIGSVYISLGYAGALITLPLAKKFGERAVSIVGGILSFLGYCCCSFMTTFPPLYITMGIIPGLGEALVMINIWTSMNRYFNKKKFIASAFGTVGSAIGSTVFPLLVKMLLDSYGFRGAVLVHSSLALHLVLCGLVLFPGCSKSTDTDDVLDRLPVDMNFCWQPIFISYLVAGFLLTAAVYIPSGLLPATAVSVGVDIGDISLAVSLGGIGNISGRICAGVVMHFCQDHVMKIWIIYLFGMGASLLIVPFAKTLIHFIVFAVSYGFFYGGTSVCWWLILHNILEQRYFARALAISSLVQGIGCAIGTPFAAFIKESTGHIGLPYYIGSGVLLLIIVVLCPFINVKKHEHDSTMPPTVINVHKDSSSQQT